MSSIARNLNLSAAEKKGDRRRKVSFFSTVALIGPDGSGKTTVAKAVLVSSPLPIKYIYMGANIDSSNIALPTSRLIHWWKVKRHKKALNQSGGNETSSVSMHGLEHRIDHHGKLWGVARLLRRVSEEAYRQLVSYLYQLRGYVVLYDRHFLFDACRSPDDLRKQRLTDSIHCWFLRKLYPRPGLVIMLDAPVDVLYSRKQEVPADYLESNRQALAKKSCYANKFVTVETNRAFDDVVASVNTLIEDHCTRKAKHRNRLFSTEEDSGTD